MNSLCLRIRHKTRFSKFPANFTLLNTTKRNTKVNVIRAIDPNHAGFQSPCHSM